MLHISAFHSSITNSGALIQLDQVPDGVLPASNNGLRVGPLNKVILIAAIGASITRAQLQAASQRVYGNPDIEPVDVGTVFESPARALDLSRAPIQLATAEEVDMYSANGGAGAEDEYAFLQFSDGVQPTVPGPIMHIRATSSTTLTAKAWSTCALTLAQSLPTGTYALVGARAKSAGGLAFRVLPTQGSAWRPGGLMVQAVDGLDVPNQRSGGWGQWLQFTNDTLPQVECFSASADTSEEFILDLVPIG